MAHNTDPAKQDRKQRALESDTATGRHVDTLVTEGYSIQDAISEASPGDVIGLWNGTFSEQVVVEKELTLVGLGSGTTTIRSPASVSRRFRWNDNPVTPIVSIEADNATVQGLSIERSPRVSETRTVAGVAGRDASISLTDISVESAESERHDVGILVSNTDGLDRCITIENCDIRNYQYSGIVGAGGGLDFRVAETTVAGLGPIRANRQQGIRVGGVDRATILGNTVADNYFTDSSVSAGVIIVDVPDAFIAWNDIEGNNNGIAARGRGDIMARRNNIIVNDTGALNLGTASFDATHSWWGTDDGPSASAIWAGDDSETLSDQPDGGGDAVAGVQWRPFESSSVDTATWERVDVDV
ncbi:right-handed parallel beta-helix repeat-containing protein [Salinibaculum salinum]|uniref:right-handed parallel beta-helix repeat-containing protein n=1 Tax=Salinibaculum salinum TaxID=3131996 RepID=UPI0030EE6EB8